MGNDIGSDLASYVVYVRPLDFSLFQLLHKQYKPSGNALGRVQWMQRVHAPADL